MRYDDDPTVTWPYNKFNDKGDLGYFKETLPYYDPIHAKNGPLDMMRAADRLLKKKRVDMSSPTTHEAMAFLLRLGFAHPDTPS